MRRLASERGEGVRNRRFGGGKCLENRKKILNRGNEPKNILKAKGLAFSGAKNELVFERKKAQTKLRMGTKIDEMLRSFVIPIRSGLLSKNSTHYSFSLSSLGRACLIRPRPATNPSPRLRRLVKAPSRSTLSPWSLCGNSRRLPGINELQGCLGLQVVDSSFEFRVVTQTPWRGQTHFAMRSVSDATDSVLRLSSLRRTMEQNCQFRVSNFQFLFSSF
jgi:hypothetical protein